MSCSNDNKDDGLEKGVVVEVDVPETIYEKAQSRCREQQKNGHEDMTIVDNLLDLMPVKPRYIRNDEPVDDQPNQTQ